MKKEKKSISLKNIFYCTYIFLVGGMIAVAVIDKYTAKYFPSIDITTIILTLYIGIIEIKNSKKISRIYGWFLIVASILLFIPY